MENIQYDGDFWRYFITALIIGIVYVVLITMIADEMFKLDVCEKTFWIAPIENDGPVENESNSNDSNNEKVLSMIEMIKWLMEYREKTKQNEYNKFVFMETIGILTILIGFILISYDQLFIASGGLMGAGVYIVVKYSLVKMNEYGKTWHLTGMLLVFCFVIYCAKYIYDKGLM